MSRIAILGAGSWGTALALSLARQHRHHVTLWAHTPSHADDMVRTRENRKYLPGFTLPDELHITHDLEATTQENSILLCVTPSTFLGETVRSIQPMLREDHIFVSAAKGLEDGTLRRMSEVVASITSIPFATLGGPSFAKEVAAALPTAIVLASTDSNISSAFQADFSSDSLRVYVNNDVTGVELGGALKNVIALAAGVVEGLQLGHNASAALITRGMAEITRLAVASGARVETMAGLAGYGDLVLTCTGSLSRNRSVGIELGRGKKLADIITSLNGKVAEGVRSTGAALGLANRLGIEMPITQQMYAILHEDRSPMDAIHALMKRPGRSE